MDSLLNTSLSPEPIASRQRLTPLAPQAKKPKVASESGDRQPSRSGTQPPDPEQLPCPRCDSTNTKFCYYNNYNLSQPRHFCKSCRRYWTRGGALRNVPVGGGTRKASSSNKRSRVATATSSKCNNLVNSINDNDVNGHRTQTTDPVVSRAISGLGCGSVQGATANANEAAVAKSGSLNSWWDGQIGMGSGLLPFGGYGLGLAPSMGFEEGLLDWPIGQVTGGDGGAVLLTGDSPDSNMWQMGGGAEDSVIQGEYFSWPEVAISTPAKALK